MSSRLFKDAAGLLVALLIGAALVGYHHQDHFDPHVAWDGFTLPGFDAHVYLAMAEEPRVFTVAPWGYRILLPGLIGSFLPPRLIVPGFEWAARLSLVAVSGLLFIYLRTLGATQRAALPAVLAMMATPSIGAVFANPFLVEPFALALLLFALIAIEARLGLGVTALALLLLSLSKEIWVVLLPLIFLREMKSGARGAALETLRAAAPALLISALIRAIWAPQTESPAAAAGWLDTLSHLPGGLVEVAPEFLLGGFAFTGLLALYRPAARDFLKDHLLTLGPLLVLPIMAATYSGAGAAASFFTDDVRRLLIYVLPFVAALAVHLDPGHGRTRTITAPTGANRVIGVIALLLAISPLALDRYSRVDLSISRDGPYVLGFARETLKTARRLQRGETVILDPAERKFAWGVSPSNELARLRFFLRRGFGPVAHYGIHDIRMREATATLIAPLYEARMLRLTLTMDARASAWVSVSAGGRRVGETLVGPHAVKATFEIPAANLFRGDNPIQLDCIEGAKVLPRLLRVELSQPRSE